MRYLGYLLASLLLTLAMGCNGSKANPDSTPVGSSSSSVAVHLDDYRPMANVIIMPGPNAQKEAQEAMILAQPGDVIEFAEGKFDFDGTLSIDGVENVTVRGMGLDKTILSFAKVRAGQGGEGMKVKANNFTIEDLTIEDSPGDAIKLQECDGLIMRRMRTWWSGGPSTENGAYGLYPVLCSNVLIEHCVAEGASDAGIYVGQSKQVIVRHCRAVKNVAGIEIENCIGADVYENVTNNNTGGILVFSLPGLTIKNGSDCRIYNNQVSNNHHENFAKTGAMVSTVPPGTGLMIMANDRVEAFDNKITGNCSAGCLVVSFLIAQRKFEDAEYDPYSEAINIHNNVFADGGTDAHGEFLKGYTDATGQRLPDIVFDGVVNQAKLVDGALPKELNYSIRDNGDATFVNLDLGKSLKGQTPNISTDLTPFREKHAPLETIEIPGVQ